MTVRVTVDYAAVGEHVLRAGFMQAEMDRRARKALEFCEATAPFDEHDHDGDHYRDRFRVESGGRRDRAFAQVVNDHPAALAVEFGSGIGGQRPQGGSSPAHHTMTRALDVLRAG